jgi:Tfp pilus assembly protein PilF
MSDRFRPLFLAFCVSAFCSVLGYAQAPAGTAAPAPPPAGSGPGLTAPADAAQGLIKSAMTKMNANDVDGALNDLTQALRANPNSTGAYVLRASIYCQKKQWPQAEADFNAAAKIAPTNKVLRFNQIEVHFMQKQYDQARTGFLALVNDPDMGDFASYKVFLCDLMGGHEAQAKQELDVFNAAMGNPSYYFANAAWDLVHHNLEDARSWLSSALRIYPQRKNAYYAQSLKDLGLLQQLDAQPAPQ